MPCRTSLARPDKARRINIFYLSAAAGAEWCCQIVQGGAESLGLCGAVSGAVQAAGRQAGGQVGKDSDLYVGREGGKQRQK